jgi:hypothetical protein
LHPSTREEMEFVVEPCGEAFELIDLLEG